MARDVPFSSGQLLVKTILDKVILLEHGGQLRYLKTKKKEAPDFRLIWRSTWTLAGVAPTNNELSVGAGITEVNLIEAAVMLLQQLLDHFAYKMDHNNTLFRHAFCGSGYSFRATHSANGNLVGRNVGLCSNKVSYRLGACL